MGKLRGLGCNIITPKSQLDELSNNPNQFPNRELSETEFLSFGADSDILILGRTPLSFETLKKFSRLKLISVYGVGVDQLDIEGAGRLNIEVKWTPGVNKREVAELVVGTMINHFRNLGLSHELMRLGHWNKNGGSSLDGKKIGIVGLGSIGTTLLQFLQPWDVEVYYCDIEDRSDKEAFAKNTCYEEIIRTCDVITFHVPLNSTTESMLGLEQVKHLKDTCLVINMSRGPVVDFRAVAAAVISGRIGGFAVDVYDIEPFDGSNWKHPKIYMTPHIGGNSVQAVEKMGQAVINNIRTYMADG